MTKQQWEKIIAAKETLGLGDQASLTEIKAAYRHLSKQYHPDLAAEPETAGPKMHALTEAYQVLLEYGANCLLPLVPGEDEIVEDEDWWMNRFGQDPLWGKG
jgi:hypothetical protein